MQRQQALGLLGILVLTAAVIAADSCLSPKQEVLPDSKEATYARLLPDSKEATYARLLSTTPVAELEGLSPDGRFAVRATGKSDLYVSGVVAPEHLQITDTRTGEVLWEDMGYITQSALWSPDSRYLALAYGGRTWTNVKLFETDTWTSWDFTLPDGSPIPEYTFLPDDWGAWQYDALNDNSLRVTVGRGGDEEQHIYRCTPRMESGQLAGSTWEQTAELLSDSYDFDHDGEPEATELVTIWEPEGDGAAWYELQVRKGGLLWSQEAAAAHMGWTSVFAYQENGADYLLRYLPTMYQGYCTYSYQVFSLNETGGEEVLRENSVEFDINWGSPSGHDFDPAAIAAFMEDVNEALSHSRLLLSTDEALEGMDPEHPQDQIWWLMTTMQEMGVPYDASASLEERLQTIDAVMKDAAA